MGKCGKDLPTANTHRRLDSDGACPVDHRVGLPDDFHNLIPAAFYIGG